MKKFFNIRPVTAAASGYCLGLVFMFCSFKSGVTFGIISLCVFAAVAFLCPLLFMRSCIWKGVLLSLFTVLFCVSAFFSLYFKIVNYAKADIVKGEYTVTGTVEEVVYYDENGYNKRAVLKNLVFKDTDFKTGYKLALYFGSEEKFKRGDGIVFTAAVDNLGLTFENRLAVSNIASKVKYSAEADKYSVARANVKTDVFDKTYRYISDTLESGMDGQDYALSLALLTGDDSLMDGDIYENFRNGGVAHIFAVSGLHIGFLAGVLSLPLRKTRRLRALLVPPVLFFYSGVCGFTSSSLRAAVMISVALIAGCTGEKYDSLSAISLSALIVLFISPFQLFSPGFALSYSVVFAIVLLSKRIAAVFKFLPKKAASAVGTVVAAQIGGLPPSLYYFGTFSSIAIAVNLIAVPIASVLFISLFFGVATRWLFLQKYFVRFFRLLFSVFDFSVFKVGAVVLGWFALAYYVAVTVFAKMYNLGKRSQRAACLILSAVVLFGALGTSLSKSRSVEFAVTSSDKMNAVCFSGKGGNEVVVPYAEEVFICTNLRRYLKYKGEVIDRLILTDTAADVQETVSGLLKYFRIKTVYYTAEYSAEELDAYFGGAVKFCAAYVGEGITLPLGSYFFTDENTTVYDGAARVVITSGEPSDLGNLTGDVLVSAFPPEDLNGGFKQVLLFYAAGDYPDSALGGNLIFKITDRGVKRL